VCCSLQCGDAAPNSIASAWNGSEIKLVGWLRQKAKKKNTDLIFLLIKINKLTIKFYREKKQTKVLEMDHEG